MISNFKYLVILLLILVSCENPSEIDVPRIIDYDYVTKKNLEFNYDTLDFGMVDKDAFYSNILKIINTSSEPVEIKSIYFENSPSIFYFDPSQNLQNVFVPNTNQKELNFRLNLRQSIVGEYYDKLFVETDTVYSLVLKSIVPDVKAQDYPNIKVNLNDEISIKIKVLNFSNYLRRIYDIDIMNNQFNQLRYNNTPFNNIVLPANSNVEVEFKFKALQKGTFTPRIEFEYSKNIISKNYVDLNIEVN